MPTYSSCTLDRDIYIYLSSIRLRRGQSTLVALYFYLFAVLPISGDMSQSKHGHQPSGTTPEPEKRRLRFAEDPNKVGKEEEETMATEDDPTTRLLLQELQMEMAGTKAQTAYLLAQHADALRDKANREFLVGGWSAFAGDDSDPVEHGNQQVAQAESRERFIKELAKCAGITGHYYKDWTFSHQTLGDSLSPITVVTVSQPWQRSKLFDFTNQKQAKCGQIERKVLH